MIAFARNWWWPRCEPFTPSPGRSATIDPTAPPSCPMLECAGPCTRPCPARSSTVSSNERISWIWPSIAARSSGSAFFQSAAVVVRLTQGTPVSSLLYLGIVRGSPLLRAFNGVDVRQAAQGRSLTLNTIGYDYNIQNAILRKISGFRRSLDTILMASGANPNQYCREQR